MFEVYCYFSGACGFLWSGPAMFTYAIRPAAAVADGEYCAVRYV